MKLLVFALEEIYFQMYCTQVLYRNNVYHQINKSKYVLRNTWWPRSPCTKPFKITITKVVKVSGKKVLVSMFDHIEIFKFKRIISSIGNCILNNNQLIWTILSRMSGTRASMFSGTLDGPAYHVPSRLKSLLQR